MYHTYRTGRRRAAWLLGATFLSGVLTLSPESPASAFPPPQTTPYTTSYVIAKQIGVGVQPSDIVVSPDGDFVYVTNQGSDNVSVIQASTGTVVDTIPLAPATNPVAIAINPSGTQVYVASTGGVGWLSVIDVSTSPRVVATSFATGGIPSDVAISPDGSLAYITLPANDDVAYVNTSPTPVAITGLITETAATFNAPTSVAFAPVGSSRAFVANSGGTASNSMSEINTVSHAVISNFAGMANSGASKIAISPTGQFGAYKPVTDLGGLYAPGNVGAFDPLAPGTSTGGGSGIGIAGEIQGIAFNKTGTQIYVARGSGGPIPTQTNVLTRCTVPALGCSQDTRDFDIDPPTGLAASPNTDSGFPLYVLHESTDNVTVLVEATPVLDTTSGPSGSMVTISLSIEEAGFDLADDAVIGVRFNGTEGTGLTASAGNTWTVTAPAGTGTVPVDVSFKLSGRNEGTSPFFNNRARAATSFTYTEGGGGGGVSSSPRLTVTFDPAGGTCGEHASPWTVRFRGTYVLPTGADCRRDGFALQGWTRDPAATAPENLLTSSISRSATLTAVWGELPVAPSDALVLSNFNCTLCTAALIVVPAIDSASSSLHVTMNGAHAPCSFTGEVFGLRWCWVDGLTNGNSYTASVAWQNQYGVGPSINTTFSLR